MTIRILEKEASPCRYPSPCRYASPCCLSSPTTRSHRIQKLDCNFSQQRRSIERELSPCRLSSPTRRSHHIQKPDCNFANTRRSRISKSQLCLGVENARLQRENEQLRLSNEKFGLESQALKSENEKLQQLNVLAQEQTSELRNEIAHLKLLNWGLARANGRLEKDNARLNERVRKQEPLVAVGMKIRMRNLEKAREERYDLREDEGIITAGNRAAHEGDLAADASMFELGFMDEKIAIPMSESERFPLTIDEQGNALEMVGKMEESFRERYADLFYDLYGIEVEKWDMWIPWGRKESDLWNMCATMGSSCGGFFAGEEKSGTKDFDRFNSLMRRVEVVKKEIETMSLGLEESIKMFEESRVVMLCLYELREIVTRARRWARDQRRGIEESWMKGRKETRAIEMWGTCILTKFET